MVFFRNVTRLVRREASLIIFVRLGRFRSKRYLDCLFDRRSRLKKRVVLVDWFVVYY